MSTYQWAFAAKKFQSAGIHPRWFLPIAPVGAVLSKNTGLAEASLGKAPGRFNDHHRVWSGLGDKAVSEGITRAQFEEFAEWPTPNVGLLGRAYPGIDSDAETEEARLFVEEMIYQTFGKNVTFAERLRGNNPRRLYAFKAGTTDSNHSVKTRHIAYRMPNDPLEQKLDIIGHGNQYVICGIHPSGDEYKWHSEADLVQIANKLTEIDNADIEHFLELFQNTLKNRGGEIIKSSGGGNATDNVDVRDLDPIMPVDVVLEGLKQLPNTPETFYHRDDIVSALAAIRAALGKKSFDPEVKDAICEWATADDVWCPEEYFDKIWNSLDHVRVGRSSLDRLFRRNNIVSHVRSIFDNRGKDLSASIKKQQAKHTDKKTAILATVAERYLFSDVNSRQNQAKTVMRSRWDVEQEWPAWEWWKLELLQSDRALIKDLQEIDGFASNKIGLANFLRELQDKHPEIWYTGESKNPLHDKGEIIEEVMPNDSVKRTINMRYISAAIRHARKPDPNPSRSQQDVRHILDFVKRLFGSMAEYELDTLAYMAQSGNRPGALLFLVGETGVGKSIWINLLRALFDGLGYDQSGVLDGSKLQNDNARRFMLGKVEGSRILSVRELPQHNGNGAKEMANITSLLKQITDAGPEGDYIQIEQKGKDATMIRNYSRIVISSNHSNSLHIETEDRRILYVEANITIETKPNGEFYKQLVDITNEPPRLAAFWRYLLTRDVNTYSPHKAPPVSIQKAERITVEIAQPPIRHARAVMQLLKASDRKLFDMAEFNELLTLMSKREHLNSGGEYNKIDYNRNPHNGSVNNFALAVRAINKSEAIKVERDFRTAHHRPPQMYIMADYAGLQDKIWKMDKEDVFALLAKEQSQNYAKHPWKTYQDNQRGDDD